MNSRERKPGEYPSVGPLAHLIDIWRCAVPSIDFIAPDLYDDEFKGWVEQYDLPGNPLFIPEIKLTQNNGVRAFYVFGEHDALGFSPFSIENGALDGSFTLTPAYSKLKELTPYIIENQGTNNIRGFLFKTKEEKQVVQYDD